MRREWLLFLVIACASEAAASLWVWGRAPTDTLRVWYPSFFAYFLEHSRPWAIIFSLSCLFVGFVSRKPRHKR